MPIFLGVTAKKLVGDPFCRGGGSNLFKTCIKVKYTVSEKI